MTVYGLITMSEIAELAGVQRPVVTTWRRRYPDFPQPVSDRGQPRFDATEVVEWLVASGRADRRQIEPELPLHLLSSLTGDALTAGGTDEDFTPAGAVSGVPAPAGSADSRRAGHRWTSRELVAAITALICLCHLDGEPLCSDEPLCSSDEPPYPYALPRPGEQPCPGGSRSGDPALAGLAHLRDRAARADPDDTLLRAEIEAIPGAMRQLPAVVDELVEAAWGCRGAYERILAARQRFAVPQLYRDAITPLLARLVAGLTGAREHADRYSVVRLAVAGPAAGDCAAAVLDHLPEDAMVTVAVAGGDPFLTRLARRRLLVRGLAAPDVTVHTRLPRADVLVAHLPYQPHEDRTAADPLAAVRDHVRALEPGQTMVVLGPADLLTGVLPPYHPAWRTRTELLSDGRVEAVVNLPGGLVPFRPGYRTALWVLRYEPDEPGQGRVLLADIAHRAMTDRLVDDLIWDVTTWRRDGHRPGDHHRAHAAQVEVTALLRPRVPLITRRPVRLSDPAADPRATVARVTELEAALAPPVPAREPLRTGLAVREERTPPVPRSIGALAAAGWLRIYPGHRLRPDHLGPDGHHRVLGAPELTGAGAASWPVGADAARWPDDADAARWPDGANTARWPDGADAARWPVGANTAPRLIDRGVLAQAYPHVRLTEPDDVVVTLTPRLGVLLDRAGFSVVEYPARILRVTEAGRDHLRPRVLAALLRAAGPTIRRAGGAVRAPYPLAALPVPVLPPADLVRLDDLLARLDARRDEARRTLAALDELGRVATTGFTLGTLGIVDEPPTGAPSTDTPSTDQR